MSSAPTPRPAQQSRPKYYDLSLAHLPLPGLVSIFHRVSGLLLFFPVLPLLLYAMYATLGSEAGYTRWHDFFTRPAVKLIALAFFWAYAHHFFAGIRYLLLDLHLGITRPRARASAMAVLVCGALATLAVGVRAW